MPDWTPPRRTLGSIAGKRLLRWARRLPPRSRNAVEGLVLRASILRGRSLVPKEALEAKFVEALELLLAVKEPLGDYLEFGVYNGSSMACMYRAAQRTKAGPMRFIGFDSFQGLKPEQEDGKLWEPGKYGCPRSVTEWYLRREGVDEARVELVEGWFQDSLNDATAARLNLKKASVVMIDCDVYSAAKLALEFAGRFIDDLCIVFFDDWHSFDLDKREMGEKRAFDEFLIAHPHLNAIALEPYHAFSEVFLVASSTEASPGYRPQIRPGLRSPLR